MMLNVVSFEDAIRITQAEASSFEIATEMLDISECLGRAFGGYCIKIEYSTL